MIPTRLLLAVVLLSIQAHADKVTWSQCKEDDDSRGRTLSAWPWSQDDEATYLNLEYCKISKINNDDFSGLPNLRTLSLKGNMIRNLDAAVFKNAVQLRELCVEINDLKEVPILSLPNVSFLDYDNNKIKSLDQPLTFVDTKQLHTLSLDHNLIEYVHPDIFQGLNNLENIFMSHNRLTYVSKTTFEIKSLKLLYLSRNLIEFVAPGALNDTQIETVDLSLNKLRYLPDHFVSEVAGDGGHLKRGSFTANPFHCTCLLELITDIKKYGLPIEESYMDNFKGTKPVCVGVGECDRLTDAEFNILRSINPWLK